MGNKLFKKGKKGTARVTHVQIPATVPQDVDIPHVVSFEEISEYAGDPTWAATVLAHTHGQDRVRFEQVANALMAEGGAEFDEVDQEDLATELRICLPLGETQYQHLVRHMYTRVDNSGAAGRPELVPGSTWTGDQTCFMASTIMDGWLRSLGVADDDCRIISLSNSVHDFNLVQSELIVDGSYQQFLEGTLRRLAVNFDEAQLSDALASLPGVLVGTLDDARAIIAEALDGVFGDDAGDIAIDMTRHHETGIEVYGAEPVDALAYFAELAKNFQPNDE